MLVAILTYSWVSSNEIKDLPYINPTGFFSSIGAKKAFLASSTNFVTKTREKLPNRPYRIMTEMSERIILPPGTLDEIRNEPNMSFAQGFYEDFHGGLAAFEPMGLMSQDELVQTVVKKHLIKVPLNMVRALSDEAEYITSEALGHSLDWHEKELSVVAMDIISHQVSRIFLGKELCRNEDWIHATQEYTHNWFPANFKLHMFPHFLRTFVCWGLPECKVMKAQLKEARRILAPVIDQRREMKRAAVAAGREVPKFDDALEWLEEEATARGLTYDETLVVNFQMFTTLVAIHTTTDLLQQAMVDLAEHPESIQPIREEIIHQLRTGGLSKSSLYNMQLLDSALKETQRLKPVETVMIRRRVQSDIRLSNGLTLKKGQRTFVDPYGMRDPAVYENPEQWDATRFFKLRSQPGGANTAQLVCVTRNHHAFGYGEHSCPGRFFAAAGVKVALCHLLMKYEWKLLPGTNANPVVVGGALVANPTVKILIRRRAEVELDFASI